MSDRAQELAEVFARLRWCVGGEFSVTINSSQAELLLDALAVPRAADLTCELRDVWIAGYETAAGHGIWHESFDGRRQEIFQAADKQIAKVRKPAGVLVGGRR